MQHPRTLPYAIGARSDPVQWVMPYLLEYEIHSKSSNFSKGRRALITVHDVTDLYRLEGWGIRNPYGSTAFGKSLLAVGSLC